jgi:hypothetical protein
MVITIVNKILAMPEHLFSLDCIFDFPRQLRSSDITLTIQRATIFLNKLSE